MDCIHCLNKPRDWTTRTLPNKGSEVSKYADTSELRFGSVQNLYLELETRPLTEPFRIHANPVFPAFPKAYVFQPNLVRGIRGRDSGCTLCRVTTENWNPCITLSFPWMFTSIELVLADQRVLGTSAPSGPNISKKNSCSF